MLQVACGGDVCIYGGACMVVVAVCGVVWWYMWLYMHHCIGYICTCDYNLSYVWKFTASIICYLCTYEIEFQHCLTDCLSHLYTHTHTHTHTQRERESERDDNWYTPSVLFALSPSALRLCTWNGEHTWKDLCMKDEYRTQHTHPKAANFSSNKI